MKQKMKTLLAGASVLAISLASSQAYAVKGTSKYVEDVTLELVGQAAIINIKNNSSNKLITELDLKVQETKMDFLLSGAVTCKGLNVNMKGAYAFFGPVSIRGDKLNSNSTLHTDGYINVEYHDGGIVEYTEDTFTVPLSKVKNGHPVLRVDPLAELAKARQSFNGSDIEFYSQDREIVIKRPISLAGLCGKKNNANKSSFGYETKDHVIQIKYKGDPQLKEDGIQLNAQLANNLPNQIQQNEDLVPFKLNDVLFNVNTPNYVGKCLPEKNPKMRMHFNISGGKKGQIDLRVKAVGGYATPTDKYFETQGIIKDPKNGGGYLEFNFPLIEKLSSAKYTWMAIANNKTHEHGMLIEARYKNFDGSNEWSEWQQFDGEVLTHRCVPQVNVPSPGGIGGYDNNPGGAIDKIQAPITQKPTPVVPTPSNIQVKPMVPKPTVPSPTTLKAPVDEPTPQLQKRAQ